MKSLTSKAIITLLTFIIIMFFITVLGFFVVFTEFSNKSIKFSISSTKTLSEKNLIEKAKNISKLINQYIISLEGATEEELLNNKYLKTLATQQFGESGYVAVINNKGKFLFHPNTKIVGQNYNKYKNKFPEMWKLITKGIKTKDAHGYYNFYQLNNKVTRKYMSIEDANNSKWRVIVVENLSEVFSSIQNLKNEIEKSKNTYLIIYSLFVFLGSIFFLIISNIFFNRITRNLRTLADRAVKIDIDNLDFDIPPSKTIEIYNLGHSIKKMTNKLKTSLDMKTSLLDEVSSKTMMINNLLNSSEKYGIIVTDAEGNIEIFNSGAQAIFDYEPEDMKGQSICIINDEKELLEKGFDFYLEKIQDKGMYDAEMYGVRRDGSKFIMSLNISARYNYLLELEGLLVILYDKTDEIKAETLKLVHEEQQKQLKNIEIIIDTIPVGILVTDKNGEVILENSSAMKILDFKIGNSSVGQNLIDSKTFKKSGISSKLKNILTADDKTFEKISNVIYTSPKTNKEIILDIYINQLLDTDKNISGAIIAFSDQTELIKSTKKMKELDTIINKSPVIAYKLKSFNGKKFEYISENIKRLGYKPEEFIAGDKTLLDLVIKDDVEKVNQIISMNESGSHQFKVMTKLGTMRWIENSLWLQKDRVNNEMHLQGIMLDITERKTAEEEISKAHKMIEKQVSILKKYVDSSVLDFMLKEEEINLLASEVINGTVCFIDICGFTAISEKQPPNIVIQMLNKYFDVIVQELMSRNGHIDKFIGDAIMTLFKDDFHIERAVEACIAVKKRINEFISEKDDNISFSPNVSIGLNTGPMISGNIGSETIERLDYTVIGDVVNTASRFQSAAKDGQIIIPENIKEKIQDIVDVEEIGELNFKNKENPIRVYNIIDFK